MTSGCTVCVRGFPTELPPERVVDKLTVHFQRARNGGGEIANIEFAPESPDCARVTFEEATVAQRVLETGKQVLTVGGTSYPLQVSRYTPGLNPNEVFLRVYVEIDYGRVLGGQEILQGLCQRYGNIVFKFRPQETTCLAKGPFTELQAFSSELLRGFQSGQRNSAPDQNSTPYRRRSAGQTGEGGSSLQGVPKTPAERKDQKAASEGPPPRNPEENHTEDFSLVMDADVYLYMRKFCQKEFSSILLQHHVGIVDVCGEGIATLYLQAAPQGPSALASAHLAISQLSQQLEGTLRKEKISWRDLGGVEGARGLPGELQRLCPRLLCHQDQEHLSLIGNRVEVSQARQYAQGFIAAREVAQEHQELDVPQAVSVAQTRGKSPTPVQPVPRKGSLPRWPRGKTGCKLTTRSDPSGSSAPRPSLPSLDTPLVGLLPGDFPQTAGHHPAEARNHTLQGAPAPEESFQSEADSPATMAGGPWRQAWRSLGSEGLVPFGVPSRSLDLSAAAGTADPKASDLGRPDGSSLPKPWSSRGAAGRLWQQDFVRRGGRGQEADLLLPRQHPFDSTLLASRRGGVSQEGPVPARPPNRMICERFSYSKLAVEGPGDEALADLCRGLRACHDGVAVSRERHHLGLSYPQEAKQQVLEALHRFSARRLAVLTEQLLSQEAQQQGRAQEDAPQQTGKGSFSSSWGQRFPDAPRPTAEQNVPRDGKARPSRKVAHAPAAGEEGCPGEPGPEA